MPKKANITNQQVEEVSTRASDMFHELMGMAEEIRAGRCDDLTRSTELARRFATLARTAADMAAVILTQRTMLGKD